MQLLFAILLLVALLSGGETTSCPSTSATAGTKPLYLLTLTPMPHRLDLLSGARIAQDEINNRSDLLPGYHIELIVDTIEGCSSFEAGTGLSNLIKHTISPPCRPIVAVNGLPCSSHTSVLSTVAGHDGYDLIQLSSANSPIFETENNRFPHLWQFLGSATVYSDAILAIMDRYDWERIGVVFDIGSVFFSGIANDLRTKLEASANKKVIFFLGLRQTREFYLDAAVSNIISEQTTILVSLLHLDQAAALLSRTIDRGLVYPDYTWIHIERLPHRVGVHVTQGHIYLHTETILKTTDKVLVSGETFDEYKRKRNSKFLEQHEDSNLNTTLFGNYWYDQVWAIALAVNKSLPVLENRNLSIDNYTIGQPEITDVIEEQMANLSFQGAGGWVEFNQYHSVSTPVDIFWVNGDGIESQVGIFTPTNFSISISKGDLPKDRPNSSLFPIFVAILLYIFDGAIILFTSSQLALLLCYRNNKVIKATSLHLSILIFIGCYLLCFGALLAITYGSFGLSTSTRYLIDAAFFLDINGISLILVTITVRLSRVYRIFLCVEKYNLSKYWKNASLIVIAVTVTLLVNFFFGIHIINEYYIKSLPLSSVLIGLGGLFIYIFSVITLFLAIRTRNIKYKEFNDATKITFFTAFTTITLTVAIPTGFILSNLQLPGVNVVHAITTLLIATACQLILYTLKVFPLAHGKFTPNVHTSLPSTVTHETTMTA